MAEYIDRAAAVKSVLRMRRPENSVAQNRMLSIIQMDMLKLPAADVAPVVRCGDTIRARFMTLPIEYPGSGANDEKRFPVRKGTVVYVHPKGRYIVAECGGVRETFFPEEVLT